MSIFEEIQNCTRSSEPTEPLDLNKLLDACYAMARLQSEACKREKELGHVGFYEQEANISCFIQCSVDLMVRTGRYKNRDQAHRNLVWRMNKFLNAHLTFLKELGRNTRFDITAAYQFYKTESDWKPAFIIWAEKNIPVPY